MHPKVGSIILSPVMVDKIISMLLRTSGSLTSISTVYDSLRKVGGKLHPVPKNDWSVIAIVQIFKNQPPIKTVRQPATMLPPCAVESPTRAAWLPLIITVADPIIMLSGGPAQVHIFPTVAAGIPPIKTVGIPGGKIGPPVCGVGVGGGFVIGHT